jgi:hypothetical protein
MFGHEPNTSLIAAALVNAIPARVSNAAHPSNAENRADPGRDESATH